MNLREVREAAEYVQGIIAGWEHHPSLAPELCEIVDAWRSKLLMQSTHILSTIDPSPGEPITEQWLHEEWGFEGVMDNDKFYLYHDYSHYLIILKDGIGVFYFDCDDGDLWPHDLHTRQQFCDLARCLGIPRRKDGAK